MKVMRVADTRRYPSFPIPGVGAVVTGPDGVLLVRRNKEPGKGLWSIPGGAIEVGEKQEDAVVREVFEETHVRCKILSFVDTADVILIDAEGQVEYHFVLNHYLAEAITFDIKPETRDAEVRWFALDELPTEEMPIEVFRLIERATSNLAFNA